MAKGKGLRSETLKFPGVRISFPVFDEPKAYNDDPTAKKKYGGNFLLDTKNNAAHAQAWNALIKAIKKIRAESKVPITKIECRGAGEDRVNQETGEIYDGYAGMKWIAAKSEKRPLLVNTKKVMVNGKKEFQKIEPDDPMLDAGMEANVTVNLYTSPKFPSRINMGLRAVQATGHGEPFGGGARADSEFEDFDAEDAGDEEEDLGLGGDDEEEEAPAPKKKRKAKAVVDDDDE